MADILTTLAVKVLHRKLPPIKVELGYTTAKEVRVINAVFQRLGIRANIDYNKVIASPTGNFVRYPIRCFGKIAAVSGVIADVEAALSQHRGRPVEITLRQPLLAFEMCYPLAPRPLLWADARLDHLQAAQALLGMNYTQEDPLPAIIDFNRRSIAHLLIAGATGSGKSVLTIGFITSLCARMSPEHLSLLFMDPKFDPEWKILQDLPHVSMCSEPADCVTVILSVAAEIEKRKRNPDPRKLLVVLDEYADFLAGLSDEVLRAVEKAIIAITTIGRGLNIHLVLITQKPTTEVVDTLAKGNITTRICGMVTTAEESKVGMGRAGVGCESLPGEGSFFAIIGGGPVQRIQSYLINGEALDRAVDDIAGSWHQATPYTIDMAAPVTLSRNVQASEAQRNAEKVLQEMSRDQLFDEAGNEIRGAQAAAVRIICGVGAANAGGNRNKAIAALGIIREME